MISSTRLLNLLFLGAIAVAVGACANPAVQECGATGVLCPSGTHCAAAQGICLPDTNTCGNAHLDPGEVCDDGNTVDGDGCSHDCSSDETCGNGIRDVLFKDPAKNEVCDDGNTKDGDGCSHDCLSLEKCGNGIKDFDEQCDDGNNTAGDGCSPKCTIEVCGNGIVDAHERCDDGNTNDGDACSHDCLFGAGCGNGIIDVDEFGVPKEECDDGNTDNNDDCRNDCVVNRCGDGIQNTHGTHLEQCDGATPATLGSRVVTPTETAMCNFDCTLASCGDGKVNRTRGEQCDNVMIVNSTIVSLNADNADCTKACQVNVCGDHLVNTAGPAHKEVCDDGNRIDTDDCTNVCTDKACGDGIVDLASGEECDLGSDTNGVSKNTDSSACPGCLLAKCGDHKVEASVEECDGTVGTVLCSSSCHIQKCGNGIIDPGEECDKGTPPNGTTPANPNDFNDDNGDCRTDCIINRCGDGFVNTDSDQHKEACEGLAQHVDHGSHDVTPTETANCNINCTAPACGDSILNRHFVPMKKDGSGPASTPEQCDDGGRDPDNNCSQDCQFERCGNGIKDPGEECDGTPGCTSTCFLLRCGNGIVEHSNNPALDEECDDGNSNDHDDCRNDCVINRCGDGHPNDSDSHSLHFEQCDGGPLAGTGVRTAIPTDTPNCNSNCTFAGCGDGIVNRKFVVETTPTSLTEQCEPPNTSGCSGICRLENCGNHIKDPGEQCDDGNTNNDDGCENDCTLPTCGNGIVDHDLGEECDDGNLSNADDCTNACKFATCGDGFIRTSGATPPVPPTVVENCDTALGPSACAYSHDPQTCSVCVACVLTDKPAPFCGDGHTDVGVEACDSHNQSCGVCPDCLGKRLSQAVGFISAAPANELNPDGMPHDTFTFSDGFTPSVTFEFTRTTGDIAPNHIEILLGPDVATAADVAGAIADAIAGQHQFQVTVDQLGSLVSLTDVRKSSLGNKNLSAIVNTRSFAVIDMAGGAGADCLAGRSCTEDNDCKSGHCTNNQCE